MTFRLSLISGCRLADETPERPVLTTPRGEISPAFRSGVLVEVLRLLKSGTSTEEELAALVTGEAGYPGLRELYTLLFDLHSRLLLSRDVLSGGKPILSSVPLSSASRFSAPRIDAAGRYALSRFAYLRRDGDRFVLESPRSLDRAHVRDPAVAALVAALAHPVGEAETRAAELGVEEAAVWQALDLLWQGGFLARVDERGETDEERSPALVQWEFHDLLFHARSRLGRHLGGYGGTFRFRDEKEPLGALSPRKTGVAVELYRPDLERLCRDDVPFTRVMEERRSLRVHGAAPITVRELGEFLYRSARVVEVIDGEAYEVARRVYPGGGAAYELELYLAVGRCDGLESGLYHYRPRAHQLTRLSARTPDVERLLETAAHTVRVESPVQVLVLLGARFGRLSWKYESMAYATVLKDVGVVYQTMYLVASAMGLAGCALGGGDADLFAKAAGTDYYDESSVGEFILGGRHPACGARGLSRGARSEERPDPEG